MGCENQAGGATGLLANNQPCRHGDNGRGHLATRWRRTDFMREWVEVGMWLRSVEFVIWFMVYVSLVPIIG